MKNWTEIIFSFSKRNSILTNTKWTALTYFWLLPLRNWLRFSRLTQQIYSRSDFSAWKTRSRAPWRQLRNKFIQITELKGSSQEWKSKPWEAFRPMRLLSSFTNKWELASWLCECEISILHFKIEKKMITYLVLNRINRNPNYK